MLRDYVTPPAPARSRDRRQLARHRAHASGERRSGAVERAPAGLDARPADLLRPRHGHRGCRRDRSGCPVRRELRRRHDRQHHRLRRVHRRDARTRLGAAAAFAPRRHRDAARRTGAARARHMDVYAQCARRRAARCADDRARPERPAAPPVSAASVWIFWSRCPAFCSAASSASARSSPRSVSARLSI